MNSFSFKSAITLEALVLLSAILLEDPGQPSLELAIVGTLGLIRVLQKSSWKRS